MADGPWTYCIDSSALIHGWVRTYPMDVLPTFWSKLDGLIESKTVVAPMDVLIELEKKEGDALHTWCKERSEMFMEIHGFQDELKQVMAKYPKLVDTAKGKSGADPMVIAMAYSGGSSHCVVTEERGGC